MSPATLNLSAEVLDSLAQALPELEELPDERARGRCCVWCGEHLSAETAIDLGEKRNPSWFPRGCIPCTLKRVLAAYKTHWATCEQCVDDETLCDIQRGLRALALELR
ncbi:MULTISPECIES: hypothetical protein [Streptomyces]|uniref:hypothetical protein n=1 Tax=Streptomyces TaxID=1883 RepID=UPI0033C501E1